MLTYWRWKNAGLDANLFGLPHSSCSDLLYTLDRQASRLSQQYADHYRHYESTLPSRVTLKEAVDRAPYITHFVTQLELLRQCLRTGSTAWMSAEPASPRDGLVQYRTNTATVEECSTSRFLLQRLVTYPHCALCFEDSNDAFQIETGRLLRRSRRGQPRSARVGL